MESLISLLIGTEGFMVGPWGRTVKAVLKAVWMCNRYNAWTTHSTCHMIDLFLYFIFKAVLIFLVVNRVYLMI